MFLRIITIYMRLSNVVKYKYGKIKCTMTALEVLKNEKE